MRRASESFINSYADTTETSPQYEEETFVSLPSMLFAGHDPLTGVSVRRPLAKTQSSSKPPPKAAPSVSNLTPRK